MNVPMFYKGFYGNEGTTPRVVTTIIIPSAGNVFAKASVVAIVL